MEEQIPPTPPISPPSAIPATPAPPQSVTRPKTFLVVILGLVLLLGVLFAGAVLGQRGFLSGVLPAKKPLPTGVSQPTPTSDPTVSWKTFKSEEMGVSLKYPQDWFSNSITSLAENRGWETVFSFPGKGGIQDFVLGQKAGIHLSYNKFPRFDIEEHANNLISQDSHHQGRETKKSYLLVDGKRAVVVDISEPGLHNRIVLFDNNGRYFVSFGVAKTEIPSYEAYLKTFNQILSTFKFLDQTSSTTDWKTYTNESHDFEFKYPQNLSKLFSGKQLNFFIGTKQTIEDNYENDRKKDICVNNCRRFSEDPSLFQKQFELLSEFGSLANCVVSEAYKDKIAKDFVLFSGGIGKKLAVEGAKTTDGSCALKIIEIDGFDVSLNNFYYKFVLIKGSQIIEVSLPLFPYGVFGNVDQLRAGFGYSGQSCDAVCIQKEDEYFEKVDLKEEPAKEVISVYDQILSSFKFTQ